MERDKSKSKQADERERGQMTTPDTVPAPVDREDQPSSVTRGTGDEDVDSGSRSP